MKASKHYLEEAYKELEKLEAALQAAENFLNYQKIDERNIAKIEQSERYHVIKRKVSEIIAMLFCTLSIEDKKNYLPF